MCLVLMDGPAIDDKVPTLITLLGYGSLGLSVECLHSEAFSYVPCNPRPHLICLTGD